MWPEAWCQRILCRARDSDTGPQLSTGMAPEEVATSRVEPGAPGGGRGRAGGCFLSPWETLGLYFLTPLWGGEAV